MPQYLNSGTSLSQNLGRCLKKCVSLAERPSVSLTTLKLSTSRKEDGQASRGALHLLHGMLEAILEEGSIAKASERIMERLI